MDFAYTGKFFDAHIGLQNNWYRWYDAATGRWVSQDPIGFEAGDANKYRYVENRVTVGGDPSGLDGPFGPIVIDDETAQRIRDRRIRIEDRLAYLRSLMDEMLKVGSGYLWRHPIEGYDINTCAIGETFSENDYLKLADHIRFAREQSTYENVRVWNASSQNLPFLPGIAINEEAFFGPDRRALESLIHEWMHNFGRQGLGHNAKYFDNVSINDLIGPYSSDNAFDRFYWFLNRTKCEDGTSLWERMRENAGNDGPQPSP